jgi:predicted DNA-binding transcriptional regulator AlpA
MLAVAPATLEKWRRSGAGPMFLKLSGRVVRYRRSDVKEFVAESARR